MTARVTETFKNRHEYIPPSIKQSMDNHLSHSMPAHLKKYQQPGSYIPPHAERQMAQHVQHALPSHLKQYGDAYVQQNIVQPSLNRPGSPIQPSSEPAATPPGNIPQGSYVPANNQNAYSSNPTPGGGADTPPSSNPYDFILNPEKPASTPFFFTPGNKTQKILVVAAGAILLIAAIVMTMSFLNKSANAQNERLIQLAKSQNEIIRVIDKADEKIRDQQLMNLSTNAKLSVSSSKNETVSSLSARGKKMKEKDLTTANADNDKVLEDGEQNNRFDETYRQLLEQELKDYQQQLKAVYDSGTSKEKEFTSSANDQINLLLGNKASSQSNQ